MMTNILYTTATGNANSEVRVERLRFIEPERPFLKSFASSICLTIQVQDPLGVEQCNGWHDRIDVPDSE